MEALETEIGKLKESYIIKNEFNVEEFIKQNKISADTLVKAAKKIREIIDDKAVIELEYAKKGRKEKLFAAICPSKRYDITEAALRLTRFDSWWGTQDLDTRCRVFYDYSH